ncbi:MAG: hypothetical protein Q8R29_01725 [bacterium]|nr:hypothetical protein [bacterium]
MPTVTISKKEYQELVKTKIRYERLREAVQEDLFSPPPIKDTQKVLKELKSVEKYNKEFLRSLSEGLKDSSYFK